jgi:hypothetical protein
MSNWYEPLQNTGPLLGVSFALRELLIIAISIWSLRANAAGRKHALALLRLLKVQIRRPPVEPAAPPPELPPGPKDPPLTGSGGGVAA